MMKNTSKDKTAIFLKLRLDSLPVKKTVVSFLRWLLLLSLSSLGSNQASHTEQFIKSPVLSHSGVCAHPSLSLCVRSCSCRHCAGISPCCVRPPHSYLTKVLYQQTGTAEPEKKNTWEPRMCSFSLLTASCWRLHITIKTVSVVFLLFNFCDRWMKQWVTGSIEQGLFVYIRSVWVRISHSSTTWRVGCCSGTSPWVWEEGGRPRALSQMPHGEAGVLCLLLSAGKLPFGS